MSAAQVKLTDLIFDEALYPRRGVDYKNVKSLVGAMEGGNSLPPLVACRATKKIIDGVHRWQAAMRTEKKTIAVEWRDYRDDAARFRDAVALNATHGMRLAEADALKVIAIGEELGLKEADIAGILHTSLTHVLALKPRYATVDRSFVEAGGKLQKIPLKGSVRHLAGETISAEQAGAMHAAPGTSYMLTVRQLMDAVRFGLLPPPDSHPSLWQELEKLRDLLTETLSKQAAA